MKKGAQSALGGLIVILIIIGIVALFIWIAYWVITLQMKTFEILFGNGWLYIGFWITGLLLSAINIPLYETAERDVIYINLGGGILPSLFTCYLLVKFWNFLNLAILFLAVLITIFISRLVSWYVKGKGVFILLLAVVFTSTILTYFLPFSTNSLNIDPLALKLAFGYIIGTLGVLIGADLLHLGMIGKDGRWGDKLSIGGAGTSDGVWSIGLSTMFWILLFHSIFC